MAAFLVHSGDNRLLLTSDLAQHPVVNINEPWRPGPDRDKEIDAASRQRIFDRGRQAMLVPGVHFLFRELGHILHTLTGYAWVPAADRSETIPTGRAVSARAAGNTGHLFGGPCPEACSSRWLTLPQPRPRIG